MPDFPIATEQDEEQDDSLPIFMRLPKPGGGEETLEENRRRIAGMAYGQPDTMSDAPRQHNWDGRPSERGGESTPDPDVSNRPIGNAYGPPAPPYRNLTTSDAARDLGEFASAAGETAKPPQTHLDQVPPAQPPPQLPADYAATQADLRAKSAVTPKYDPQTGETLDKYKVGTGARIGRAFLDAARGFLRGGLGGAIAGPLEGAFGNRNAPGYYGKGAVNSQYGKDEQARQQAVAADTAKIGSWEAQQKEGQEQWKEGEEVRKDTIGQAYKQDLDEIKQRTEEEREQHNQETEALRKQLQDATTPTAKHEAEFNARQNVASKIGLKGDDLKMYLANGKLPDDQLQARRLEIEEQKLGLQRREVGLKEREEQRKTGDTNELGLTTNEQRGVNAEAPGVMGQIQELQKQRALNIAAGADTKSIDVALAPTGDLMTRFNAAVTKVRSARRPTPAAPGKTTTPAPASPATPKVDKTQPSLKTYKTPGGKVYNLGGEITVQGKKQYITYIDRQGHAEHGDQPPPK